MASSFLGGFAVPARIPMTEKQRAALLALPDTEEAVVQHHSLDAADLAAIADSRTPETRLGYAPQLCCLRYPGRHLRKRSDERRVGKECVGKCSSRGSPYV